MTPDRLRPIGIAALVVAGAIIAVQLLLGARATRNEVVSAFLGTPVAPSRLAPVLVLRDAGGRRAPLIDPRSSATVVFFGYTHCTDSCPLAMAVLRAVRPALSRPERTRLVFVTIDPARDDPAAMRAYVRTFDAHIVGLTGSRRDLAKAWLAFGVRVRPSGLAISHGEALYLVDAQRRVLLQYPPDAQSADIAADANRLALAP